MDPQLLYPGKLVFDGKRMRKPITRRLVDHGSCMTAMLEDLRMPARPLSSDPLAALEPRPEYLINVPHELN